jgi:hypothetical protein
VSKVPAVVAGLLEAVARLVAVALRAVLAALIDRLTMTILASARS